MSKDKESKMDTTSGKTGEVKALSLKQITAALDDAHSWKPAESDKVAADFRKGDLWESEKSLRGVYLGAETNGKRIQHKMAIRGKDGKLKEVAFNGTFDLNRQLLAVEPGKPCLIEYVETVKLDGGRSTKKFNVYTQRDE